MTFTKSLVIGAAIFLIGIYFVFGTVSPLLSKCAVVVAESAIKTPDDDEKGNWSSAENAIINAYLGNFGSLQIGERVDVKYPNGAIVQMWIQRVKSPDRKNPRGSVTVNRFGNGIPDKDSFCN